MKVSINGNRLTIEVEANVTNPTPSKSGKTVIVATSRGNQKTGVKVQGRELIVGFNAYIERA